MSETDQKGEGRTEARGPEQGRSASALDELRAQLEESGERLQAGPTLNLPGDAALPVRSLSAVAIFVAAFVVLYLLSWAALGTLGLAVGLLIGLAAGALAVKLFADRAGD